VRPHSAELFRLRQVLASMHGDGRRSQAEKVRFGIAAIDDVLGGGLPRGALHEIAAASEADMPAAASIATALAVRTPGPAFWILDDRSLNETGVPYGPGLEELGLAPERLVWIAAPNTHEVLWAAEEAMQCRGVGPVIAEVRSPHLALTATRRLSLAAARGDALGMVLRCHPDPSPSAAATRWVVNPAPAGVDGPVGVGAPRMALWLTRNRWGFPGHWKLEWDGVDRCFVLASADRQCLAQPARDRPRPAALV
jgi:protein ImuA